MTAAEISIIVCTRGRPQLLRRCLRSLVEDPSRRTREILVVDNGSPAASEAVATMAAGRCREGTVVRFAVERRVGKARALNRGVRLASGELLLFTDDDVVVDPGWTDALADALGGDGVGAAGGKTVPDWPSPPPVWMDATMEAVVGLVDLDVPPGAPLSPGEVLGANMGLRADAVAALVGPFEESLGPHGNFRPDFEEVFLLENLSPSLRIVYEPRALAHHRMNPDRLSLPAIRLIGFDHGIGLARIDAIRGVTRRPLPRRAAGAVAALLRARAMVRRHQAQGPADGPAALAEFSAFMGAGQRWGSLRIGTAVARAAARWCAA